MTMRESGVARTRTHTKKENEHEVPFSITLEAHNMVKVGKHNFTIHLSHHHLFEGTSSYIQPFIFYAHNQ